MSGKRQKYRPEQLGLALLVESRSETPTAAGQGFEPPTAKRVYESPADTEALMEEVCERENCQQALRRVKANKGSPGVDRMTVRELPDYLKRHWPAIREQLLSGTYRPHPVKRGEIDKPGWIEASIDLETVARVRREGQVFNHRQWDEQRVAKPVSRVDLTKRS